ncbi:MULTISPECIES: YdcF family protein [unclassified Breznakia]|uniref:YdcF family protein n=1 Tax=unclassified Breznakia TaxID=2623764 RepID=UPI002476442C|nr:MULTISPECIES: YdcF family protein [unclassified Breznakia]MDH6367648.1 uncharacterized SAM-binding protein YcdF (DUF218 family) [Breznakia sp. PH1-1]MDH6404759.1 uncharacterized SAM-binding protein YcdF (DUF218 family) [Breznakia sp. PF1-11]MDH6412474.1 uncharacterized SAM-binding protein YcdF (DUF218 family) [Breznakia sp. PFB1-11]MDH6414834.1 uncharacterized SAM-binding protein YcdF (DUF218 family) [Breznakia sp. PFB1-14]MDH6417122.1 uncharacterized SAM-binding protein YcdF (DUF218 family
MQSYIYIVTLVVIVLFLVSWMIDRRKITNGFLFNVAIGCTCISFVSFGEQYAIPVITFIGSAGLLFIFAYLSVGIIALMIVSIINGVILIFKEGRGLMNLFVLVFGIGIFILLILGSIRFQDPSITKIQQAIVMYSGFVIVYFLIHLANYFMSSLLYSVYKPRLNKDYIIVLGAGLINGETPTPLLARRIDKALSLYFSHVNKKKNRKIPKLIMSGGQGSDEKISEADAMATYAREHGVPREDIIIENKSRNTKENMMYSKMKIEERSKGKYEVVFATSNYHVMRSSILARKVGLNAQGIGSRTPFYFWFGASLREFIAILYMYKWAHIIVLGLGLIGVTTLYVIEMFFV